MSERILYEPDQSQLDKTLIGRFISSINENKGTRLESYEDLWKFSVQDTDTFWKEVAVFFEMNEQATAEVVSTADAMPHTAWFPSTQINYSEYALDAQNGKHIAIRGYDELGPTRTLSGAELSREVLGLAAHLRSVGVHEGDRVVGYIANTPEAVVALLATATIGAIWSSVGLDYAPQAAADRLAPLEPKVLIGSLSYTYRGEVKLSEENMTQLIEFLPSVTNVVTYSQRSSGPSMSDFANGPTVSSWPEAISEVNAHVKPVEFNTPLWVLFSSGTTGKPKGIVHSHGGVVIELLKMLSFHLDVGNNDTFFWYSSPSWVMWNIQASALLTGASIVTYDGHPSYPTPMALWNVVSASETTFFGASPGFLDQSRFSSEVGEIERVASGLQGIGTSGAPINPETHVWALEMSQGAPVHSISGGTDICSAFAGGALNLPIYAGEISAPALGAKVEAWDEDGMSVTQQVGELVVTKPMPSMPVMFWDDPQNEKYLEAYFKDYEGVWRHGDWITFTERGSLIFHGRSDATLNRHGVRLGSSDIYSCVDNLPGIQDSLVLGVERSSDPYWMPLFVVLDDNAQLTSDYESSIRNAIRSQVSPRHIPDQIIEIPEVPRTLTGKRLEVPLKKILQGANADTAVQKSAVANPASIPVFLEHAKRALTEFDKSSRQ